MALSKIKNIGRKIFGSTFSQAKSFWRYMNRPINTKRLEEIKEEQRKIQYYTNLKF
jgi:hypothetical protein